MMALGSRVVLTGESLEGRIEAALQEELDRQARAGMAVISDRGMGLFTEDGLDGSCLMSMRDVARVAAQAAKSWF